MDISGSHLSIGLCLTGFEDSIVDRYSAFQQTGSNGRLIGITVHIKRSSQYGDLIGCSLYDEGFVLVCQLTSK